MKTHAPVFVRLLATTFGIFLVVLSGCEPEPSASPIEKADIATGLRFTIGGGEVLGRVHDGVRSFKGLPYAATPTGALRFRPPTPHAGWTGTLDAGAHGFACSQAGLVTGTFDEGSGEDCLHLSVHTPNPAPSKALAVIVWLHGGHFISGHSGNALYDGADLVRDNDVVVVTVNYRLGALGLLNLAALRDEDGPETGSSANIAIQDQIAALQWVSDNIDRFGGDKGNVTVMGSSSGGLSVCVLLTTSGSFGLFQRAVIQSGGCHVRMSSKSLAQRQSLKLANAVGCSSAQGRMTCLRAKTAAQLATALKVDQPLPGGLLFGTVNPPVWLPFVDGTILAAQPGVMLEASKAHFVEVIVGSNRDEARGFAHGLLGSVSPKTDKEYLHAIGRRFGVQAHEVVARYPPATLGGYDKALAQVGTDAFFTCPARRTAKALAGYTTAYRYHFEREPTGAFMPEIGVFHGAEIPYVMGNSDTGAMGDLQGNGIEVSALVQGYWVRFAKTGNPNGGGDPVWPKWSDEDPHMRFTNSAGADTELRKEACDFWDTIPFHEE
jgi:para-nitrobenzyl esterase